MDHGGAPPPSVATKPARTTSGSGAIILNKYQLGRLLGRGSFAKVYIARSLIDDKEVAIKVIDKAATVDAAMEPQIVREISAMRRLNPHSNVIKLHEVLATKSKIYLIMELAQGGELFAKLKRAGKMPESTARRFFQQLVSALHFCHLKGVTHRDIKPQNLLLDGAGNLKISDFGLSAMPEQLKNGVLHTACGTPAYTAPEIFRRGGYDGQKADAWSCGVILFVFLAGYLPFNDSNLPNMYQKIHRRDFKFPDWISKPARFVIYRLLDPNPSTRLSIESLMSLSWFKKSLKVEQNDPVISGSGMGQVKDSKCMTQMNAFDIISMSSGLDLSGLFEGSLIKKENRFTSTASVGEIEERLIKIGGDLEYSVEIGKGGAIRLVKGRLDLTVEILELARGLLLVEMKVVVGGGVEVEELPWKDFKSGLEGIVISWHGEIC